MAITAILCPTAAEALIHTDFQSFDRVGAIPQRVWNVCVEDHNIMMCRSYLRAIESSIAGDIGFKYVVVSRYGKPIMLLAFQLLTYQGKDLANKVLENPNWLNRHLVAPILSKMKFKIVLNGNSLITGTHGVAFAQGIDTAIRDRIYKEAVDYTFRQLNKEDSFSGLILKDFYPSPLSDELKQCGYQKFVAQPNMVMDIPVHWKSLQDYLGAMNSKHRVRTKKALDRASGLKKKYLSAVEIKSLLPRMNELFDDVISRSGFVLYHAPIDYFLSLKQELEENFQVIGYFTEQGTLVSFISFFNCGDTLLAGYTGHDHTLRDTYDLYLNILYTLIEESIILNKSRLEFGRTAMEIKSSVGARPIEMHLFMKHRNPLIHFVLKRLIDRYYVPESYVLRNPFKEEKG